MRLFKITKRVLDDESVALAQQVKNGNEEAWKKLKEVCNNYITASFTSLLRPGNCLMK
jgi:hypothetical protein